MIWKDTDDMHLGMDGLYKKGESEESDELEEHDWAVEIGELKAERIKARQNGEESEE